MATKAPSKRACDQCNYRRVKCSGTPPCDKCFQSKLNCTFEKASKGRSGKRIHALKENGDGPSIQPQSSPIWPTAGPSELPDTPPLMETLSHSYVDHVPGHLQASPSLNDAHLLPPSNLQIPAILPSLTSSLSETLFGAASLPWDPNEFSASPSSLNANLNTFPFAWPLEVSNEHWSSWISDLGTVASSELPRPPSPLSPRQSTNDTTTDSESITQSDSNAPPPDPMLHLDEEPLSDSNLIPLIGIFFERMHPIMPIFTRSWLLGRIDEDEHRTQPQFGAMLLALSALALIQPFKTTERALRKARLQRARVLLDTCAKSGCNTMLGQNPSLDAVLTSLYMFACLFGLQEQGAASFRLREAVTLAKLMSLHQPSLYHNLPADERERRLRTFWLLCITERAFALQGGDSIGFSGLPYESMADLTKLIQNKKLDDFPVSHLLLFNSIDSSFIECWNGRCPGRGCTQFDARRALHLHSALDTEEPALTPSVSVRKTTSWERADIQRIDTVITRQWLHTQVWQTCQSHELLTNESPNFHLQFSYILDVAQQALQTYLAAPATAREAHGIGLIWKLRDIALILAASLPRLPPTLTPLAENVLDQYDGVLRSCYVQDYAQQLEASRMKRSIAS